MVAIVLVSICTVADPGAAVTKMAVHYAPENFHVSLLLRK